MRSMNNMKQFKAHHPHAPSALIQDEESVAPNATEESPDPLSSSPSSLLEASSLLKSGVDATAGVEAVAVVSSMVGASSRPWAKDAPTDPKEADANFTNLDRL